MSPELLMWQRLAMVLTPVQCGEGEGSEPRPVPTVTGRACVSQWCYIVNVAYCLFSSACF